LRVGGRESEDTLVHGAGRGPDGLPEETINVLVLPDLPTGAAARPAAFRKRQ